MSKSQIENNSYKFIIHSSQYEKQTETPSFSVLGYLFKSRLPYHKIKGDEEFLSTDKTREICSTLNYFHIASIWLQLFFLDVF